MRILGISHIDSGCGYHRIVIPMAMMDGITGIVTNAPNEEIIAQGFDIVFYNRVSPFDQDWDLTKKTMGVKVVMDIDDDWELPINHIVRSTYDVIKPRIENNIRTADLVTCTNQRLADKVYKLNKNVLVLPNAIPYGFDQFHDMKEESDYVRLFWAGSITHEHDINILKNPIRRLTDKRIQMVLGGYNNSNETTTMIWDRMASVFTNNKQLPFKILQGTTPNKYMEMYQEGDVMLIPLEKSSWHASKSNLKVLESAAKSIPCIVSDVEPYNLDKDAPILWVRNQTDWYKHIMALVKDKNLREDYGKKLYQWAEEKYNHARINAIRQSAFADLIKV
jgi:glycosyltransferase involved in cell wall biosynthesis